MRNQYLFSLPIYLNPRREYYDGLDRELEQKAKKMHELGRDSRKDIDWYRNNLERQRDHYLRAYGGAWEFNQVFGFLGIFPLGIQMRGATWYTSRKMARKNIGKKFISYIGKAFEFTVLDEWDSTEIFSRLMNRIQRLRREPPYERRFLDTENLELTGPFIDWRRLVDASIASPHGDLRIEDLPELLMTPSDAQS